MGEEDWSVQAFPNVPEEEKELEVGFHPFP
jgi:hypothetical protein